MKTAVIVPFYETMNTMHVTVMCNLILQTHQDIELIIGDDTSHNIEDGLKNLNNRGLLNHPKLTIFTLLDRKPWGLGDIYSIAADMTDAELLVFADADIVMMPGHIEKHVLIQQNRGPVLVQGAVQFVSPEDEQKILDDPNNIKSVTLFDWNRKPHPYDDPYCCNLPNCTECSWLCHGASILAQPFKEIGGFRPEYAGYYVPFDGDLSYRLETMGIRVRRSFLPSAINLASPTRHTAKRPTPGTEEGGVEGWRLYREFLKRLPGNRISTTPRVRQVKLLVKNGVVQ
jgi:GT2 family glycosyltransferase